jgi:hypothetical protein
MCSAYAEAKSYILVSQLDNEVFSKYVEDKEAAPLSGFAFTVISVIHLAGGKIPEGKGRGFKNYLRRLASLHGLMCPELTFQRTSGIS